MMIKSATIALAAILLVSTAGAEEADKGKCSSCEAFGQKFSEGAMICTGKHMKQQCKVGKWEVVTEKDSDPAFCEGPLTPK